MQRTCSIRSEMPVMTSGQRVVAEARVNTVDEDRRAAFVRRRDHVGRHRRGVAVRVLQEDRAGRHDVDPGPQELREVAERLHQPVVGPRGVHDAVRLEGQQRVGVVGRGDAQTAAEPGELAGVLADLVRVRDPDPDQLEVGPGVDAGDRVLADVPRAPLHDAVGPAHERVILQWVRRRPGRVRAPA